MALRSLLRIHTFPYCVLTLAYNVGRVPKEIEDIGMTIENNCRHFSWDLRLHGLSVDTHVAIWVNILGSSINSCPYHAILIVFIAEALWRHVVCHSNSGFVLFLFAKTLIRCNETNKHICPVSDIGKNV